MIEISGFSFGVPEFWLLIAFVTTFLVQFFYQVLVIAFTLSGKKNSKQEDSPSISIIITSRNYEENLRSLIPSLLEQDYPDFEVVVVDDCSSDGSEWYLTELKLQSAKLKTSRILQETDFPNALAITIGIRAATKDWLSSYAKAIQPETEAVFGFVKYTNGTGSMRKFFRYENFDSFLLYGSASYLGLPMPVTDMNIAYKREEFLKRRGFAAVLDTPFSENELYLNKISNRKNAAYLLDPTSAVYYDGEMNWYDGINYKKKQLMLRRKFSIGQIIFLSVNTISRMVFDISMVALLILSPWRLWVAAIWLFKIVHEMVWGIVGMKRLKEKNLFPGLVFLRSILPLFNGLLFVNQFITGSKRKWK
jgi:glycosyltransferase involved in cell wall biosynthesis